jgi:hypothetical protein
VLGPLLSIVIDNLSPLEINHHRSIVHAFFPCPIVDSDDFDMGMGRRSAGARASLELSQTRGVTDPHAEAAHQPFGWPSANAMPEQANNSHKARRLSREWRCEPWNAFGEDSLLAILIAASRAYQANSNVDWRPLRGKISEL